MIRSAHSFWLPRIAGTLLLACVTNASAGKRHKVGPHLRRLGRTRITKQNVDDASREGQLKLFVKNGRAYARVLVRADSDTPPSLEALGAEDVRRHGSVFAASIPVDQLDKLDDLPGVISARAARKLRPNLDFSVPDLQRVNGVNVAWNQFGGDAGTHPWWGANYDPAWFEAFFTHCEENSINCARLWIHCDGRASPEFDASGYVTGLDTNFLSDLEDIFARAADHGIAVMPCLWSFDMVVNRTNEAGPYAGIHTDLIADSAKTMSYITNALIPIVERFADTPNLYAWDIINEPEWCGYPWLNVNSQANIQRFCAMIAAAIHDNCAQQVTVGSASLRYSSDISPADGNWWSDTQLQAQYADPNAYLDFYQIHYFNWMYPSGWDPFHLARPVTDWGLDKRVLIGECPATNSIYYTVGEMLENAYGNGYEGLMFWSYTDPNFTGEWSTVTAELRSAADAHAGLALDRLRMQTNGYIIQLPPYTTGSGSNVIVGVVDTGIDVGHEDFKDAGGTRVLWFLDQDSGNDYSKTEIDAWPVPALIDDDGHGTHVAGTAAGNGTATGNGLPAYQHVGVAPNSDLIIVDTTFYDDDILDGVAYVFGKARALGRPAVVNLSLGGHWGPHDGTDPFDVGLDALTGPGQIVVASAGNEGSDRISDNDTWAGSDLHFQFAYDLTGLPEETWFVIWHNGGDSYTVRIGPPNGQPITWPVGTTSTQSKAQFDLEVTNPGYNEVEYNGKKLIYIYAVGTPAAGTWDIWLTPDIMSTNDPDVAHIWIPWDRYYEARLLGSDGSVSVGSPGTAKSLVTVGSYATRRKWTSAGGTNYTVSSTLGEISSFSSLGPTADGRTKPDIAAPGAQIGAAMSSGSSPDPAWILADGEHRLMQGTSMSCPHITGLAALLLEKHPSYSPEAIKSVLGLSARRDSFTGSPWNDTWGRGKADGMGALGVADQDLPRFTGANQFPAGASASNTLVATGAGFTPLGSGEPARYIYQWQMLNSDSDPFFENISGASYPRLEPQQFTGGDVVRLVVTPYESVDQNSYTGLLVGASLVVTQTIGSATSFVSHAGAEEWCMVSIPTLDDSAIKTNFAGTFYEWNETNQAYAGASTIERGRGYWIYVQAGEGTMNSEGDGPPTNNRVTGQLTYTGAGVKPGRHLLGNPFNKPIYWENTYVSTSPASFTMKVGDLAATGLINNVYYSAYDNVGEQYRYYDPADFEQRDGKIFPWEAFWVKVRKPVYLMIPYDQTVPSTVTDSGPYPLPPRAASTVGADLRDALATGRAEPLARPGPRSAQRANPTHRGRWKKQLRELSPWRIKIWASSGRLRDDYNYVGMHVRASDGYDAMDIPDAGTLSGNPMLVVGMQHNDWGQDAGLYCVDTVRWSKEYSWSLTVSARGLGEPVKLQWQRPPAGWELSLVDTATGETIDMRSQRFYAYTPASEETRTFTVTARLVS
ncbi:S8 family serine peptidase, partial [Verrucomicrobiota bacterium]